MPTLKDTPRIRQARAEAYEAGKYKFAPPPVYSGNWSAQAWMNWVVFDDPKLTGFLPYIGNEAVIDGVHKPLKGA